MASACSACRRPSTAVTASIRRSRPALELRSPGILLTSIGLFFAYGIISPQWRNFALWAAAVFYLGYATARALSLALDGIPSTGLLAAGAFELTLGLTAAALLLTQRRTIAA